MPPFCSLDIRSIIIIRTPLCLSRAGPSTDDLVQETVPSREGRMKTSTQSEVLPGIPYPQLPNTRSASNPSHARPDPAQTLQTQNTNASFRVHPARLPNGIYHRLNRCLTTDVLLSVSSAPRMGDTHTQRTDRIMRILGRRIDLVVQLPGEVGQEVLQRKQHAGGRLLVALGAGAAIGLADLGRPGKPAVVGRVAVRPALLSRGREQLAVSCGDVVQRGDDLMQRLGQRGAREEAGLAQEGLEGGDAVGPAERVLAGVAGDARSPVPERRLRRGEDLREDLLARGDDDVCRAMSAT